MRAFSLFTFAVAIFGSISALTIPVKCSDFDSIDVLEIHEPAQNTPPNRIKFSSTAKTHMDNLSLVKGSAECKQVKEYHRNIISAEMAKNHATSAQIKNLAHSIGSKDNKYHITTTFWGKDGDPTKRMKSTYGTLPNLKHGDLFHVYANKANTYPVYKAAIEKAGKVL